jgi:hypothetical protein
MDFDSPYVLLGGTVIIAVVIYFLVKKQFKPNPIGIK